MRNSDIERLDNQRMTYLAWYLVGCALFVILSLVRYFLRIGDMNSQPIGTAVLVGLILSLLLLGANAIRSARLNRKIMKDPVLKEALLNELIQAIELQSWRAAYLGAAGASLFFALSWVFYPVCDPVLIALTSIVTGLGAYQGTFYFLYWSA